MTPVKAVEYLEKLAQYFEGKTADSQEDAEIQAFTVNAKGARDIAKLIIKELI